MSKREREREGERERERKRDREREREVTSDFVYHSSIQHEQRMESLECGFYFTRATNKSSIKAACVTGYIKSEIYFASPRAFVILFRTQNNAMPSSFRHFHL
jgi:hypothetical protein